jgi:hypothetical protein
MLAGLSEDIKLALDTIIVGLEHQFMDTSLDDPEKLEKIMKSKVSSFDSSKSILVTWMSSPNAPNSETLVNYVEKIVRAGDIALLELRQALRKEIDYTTLDPTKHDAAIKARSFILESILSLNKSVAELRKKLDEGDLDLTDREFAIGYPERFAKGEFFPAKDYHKKWYNKKENAVRICPFGTEGEIIELEDLKIQLPKPPRNKKEILLHDLPKKEQYWRRQEEPEGITPDNVELWDDYIKEEFRRRREGIWFMNNGKPVYMTGNMYFALQHCVMLDNGGFMDFREAQLKMFYHLEACIVDKRCLGQLFVKSRRTGFTYCILAILLNMATSTANGKYGMTSKSGDDVQEAWDKYSYMFLNLPFYFRPVVKGKEDSPNELFFGKPSDNSKESKKRRDTGIKDYLNTNVDWRPTKNDSYDSVKLNGYLGDEAFKWVKPHDYISHLGMVAPTMMPGGRVVGKAFIGSTMGPMAKGGSQGVELVKGSRVKERNEVTGKTATALYMYFLPAHENMEEFTDKYGKCWTETPPPGTINVLGEPITMGSIDYLLAVEDQKKAQSDKALNEQYRTYPRTLDHALRDEAKNSVFNLTKLYEQKEYNRNFTKDDLYTVGNFEWVDEKDGDVVFHPNPKGRFKVAWIPSAADNTQHLANNVIRRGNLFFPGNTECVRFGCDPFSLKSTHGKGSKGGLHGKTILLPEGGAPSNKFVVEYLARPSDEVVFFEDVIKCIRFYGAPILVESNRIDLLRHMRNRGYRGFAMDRLDRPKAKLNPNEREYGGQVMSGKDILDSHMNAIGSWIENYVGVYTDPTERSRKVGEMGEFPFDETLDDWLNFDPDKRTEYDATISSGLAIMACQTEKYKGKAPQNTKISVGDLFKKYNHQGQIGRRVSQSNFQRPRANN